jgi:Flp pilus assembly pilin Flp
MRKYGAEIMRRKQEMQCFGLGAKALHIQQQPTGKHDRADHSYVQIYERSAFLMRTQGGEKMRRLFEFDRKGQSTLEYVIIWTAIIAAILVAANTVFKGAIEQAVDDTSQKIETEVQNLVSGIGD